MLENVVDFGEKVKGSVAWTAQLENPIVGVATNTLLSAIPVYTHSNTATPRLFSNSTGFKASYL